MKRKTCWVAFALSVALAWTVSGRTAADEPALGEIGLPAIAAATAQEPFSPMVPVMLSAETNENLEKDFRRMREEFGLKRFILVGPSYWRRLGRADLACYE